MSDVVSVTAILGYASQIFLKLSRKERFKCFEVLRHPSTYMPSELVKYSNLLQAVMYRFTANFTPTR